MASAPNWPVMGNGSSGTNVMALQLLLIYRGANISADGIFGNNTEAAVRSFQASRNLGVDGIAGQNTLNALIVTVANRTNNSAARAAQRLLSKFEYLTVDGDFGADSERATRAFQSKMGITVNGIVYPTTWRFLFGYNAYPAEWYSSNAPLTDYEMRVNAQYILNYLRNRGWTKEAVCGMLGNMEVESYINPGVWHGCIEGSAAFGLVQWSPPSKFFNWADDNSYAYGNMIGQLQRLIYEVENREQYSEYGTTVYSFYDYTQSTLTAYELGRQFAWHYEDGNFSEGVANDRGSRATSWFNTLT